MATLNDIRKMIQKDYPCPVTQRQDNLLYFDWTHYPYSDSCQEVLEWFDGHGIKPFIAEQNYPGGQERAGHDFRDRPELAVLFKLRFG